MDLIRVIKLILLNETKAIGNLNEIEKCYYQEAKEYLEFHGYGSVPDFILSVIVLEKLKKNNYVEESVMSTLQRNLTYDEMLFLRENKISFYFGDFEIMEEEYIIKDFSNMLYLLEFNFEKKFLYGKVMQFSVLNEMDNNAVEEYTYAS